jgi:polyhydroxyalkanoate synthesis regulator phasin
MENAFKNFFYTGVGFISIAADKFKKAVDELVKDGKLSKEEGKKIVDDFIKSSDERKSEFESTFKNVIEDTIEKLKFASKEEVEKLKNRITVLENLINKNTNKNTDKDKD